MDYTVHGILPARILEWVASPSPGVLLKPGMEPRSPHCRRILYQLSHREASAQAGHALASLWLRGLGYGPQWWLFHFFFPCLNHINKMWSFSSSFGRVRTWCLWNSLDCRIMYIIKTFPSMVVLFKPRLVKRKQPNLSLSLPTVFIQLIETVLCFVLISKVYVILN